MLLTGPGSCSRVEAAGEMPRAGAFEVGLRLDEDSVFFKLWSILMLCNNCDRLTKEQEMRAGTVAVPIRGQREGDT